MKIHIALLLAIFAAISSFGQQKFELTQADQWIVKSKNQKAYGWISTGIGVLVLASSLLPANSSPHDHVTASANIQHVTATTYIIGGSFITTGLAFFRASSKTKRKATATAFISLEKIKVPDRHAVRNQSFPTMGLKLSL